MTAKPPVAYDSDDLPGGHRIVRTRGLQAVGQMEIAAWVGAGRAHEWDHRVMRVLNFVANYVVRTGARILPGESMGYGWTQLRFLERTPSLLEAHELEDVYSEDPQPSVVPGVDRAIRLGEAADDVMRRNRLSGTSDFPYRGKTAISCRHWPTAPIRKLFMERVALRRFGLDGHLRRQGRKARDSRPREGASRPHRGAPTVYRAIPHVANWLRGRVDQEGAIVFPSNEDTGRRDPVDPYDFGPASVTS